MTQALAQKQPHLRLASSSFLFCSARFMRSSFSDLSIALGGEGVCRQQRGQHERGCDVQDVLGDGNGLRFLLVGVGSTGDISCKGELADEK